MRESVYQAELIKKIQAMFPDCFIVKNDASENQGIPDILILFHDMWAMLEIKISARSKRQPNQEYFVDHFNNMAFAAFICPENEEMVLNDLQQSFWATR